MQIQRVGKRRLIQKKRIVRKNRFESRVILTCVQSLMRYNTQRTMLSHRHLQLVAMLLVGISVVAFTPRLQHPHLRLSCGSIEATTLSGPQRFTDDSSRLPDLKAGYAANGVPLRQDLKLISEDQIATPSLRSGFETPFIRPIVRRNKLLPLRASNQDPL